MEYTIRDSRSTTVQRLADRLSGGGGADGESG
jgi:hypothetical protein